MVWTDYSTGGTIVIIIGIVLLIAGIIILALDQSSQKVSEWWVWALIVIGVIALLVGICLFFIPSPRTLLEKHLQGHSLTELQDPDCPPLSKARMGAVLSEHHVAEHHAARALLAAHRVHREIDVTPMHADPCEPTSQQVPVIDVERVHPGHDDYPC
uniref:Uncharacterized protein n=1 Tax=Pithovirus LCPAC304 TaxID=2506594 RepID=A0A481ZA59_9VIRU|nr:MAG: hypothetical protein LCPAC304_05990 [Pithovirus LCPAC304]